MAASKMPTPGKLDPKLLEEFDNEKKKKDDEIRMLKEDLDNEKDNVKNLKIERKELFA